MQHPGGAPAGPGLLRIWADVPGMKALKALKLRIHQWIARLGNTEMIHELEDLCHKLQADVGELGKDIGPEAHDAVLIGELASAAMVVERMLTMFGVL